MRFVNTIIKTAESVFFAVSSTDIFSEEYVIADDPVVSSADMFSEEYILSDDPVVSVTDVGSLPLGGIFWIFVAVFALTAFVFGISRSRNAHSEPRRTAGSVGRSRIPGNPAPYDVFISFKNTSSRGGLTVDRAIAENLHKRLREEGLNVFFSEKDLRTTEFMDEIYQALDEARLLILVGTSLENINSEWVKSEWSTFFGSMKSGRKPDSQIMTVLQGISTCDLPIQLEHFESFSSREIEKAVEFAFKALGMTKNSDY